MRHLLVPTDFSPSADNAMAYARLLAREFSARLTLVYIHPLPHDPLRIGEVNVDLYQEQEKVLTEQANRLRLDGLEVDVLVQLGDTVSRLKSIIQRSPTDLVVMGCQGEHYLGQKFFGSTTTALLDQVTTPILAVPHGFTPAFPQNIVWAADSIPVRSTGTLEPLFALAERSPTELRVFHYQEAGEESLSQKKFRELLSEVRHDFFIQLADGDSPEGAIREFLQTVRADLVTVVHRHANWFSRLVIASNTRQIVWRSPVPVLILQEVHQLSTAAR